MNPTGFGKQVPIDQDASTRNPAHAPEGISASLGRLGCKSSTPSGPIRKNNVREYNVSVIAEHLDGRFIDVNTQLDHSIYGVQQSFVFGREQTGEIRGSRCRTVNEHVMRRVIITNHRLLSAAFPQPEAEFQLAAVRRNSTSASISNAPA